MLKQIHHNKNEKQEVEFYEDKECTQAFDFNGAEKLYIQLINGELTPLVYAIDKALCGTTIYCSYVNNEILVPLKIGAGKKHITIVTLNDITPNLSKYIPKDNAVLFLSEEDMEKYDRYFPNIARFSFTENDDGFYKRCSESGNRIYYKKLTIFLPHGTRSELQKAEKVAKELNEKYGVEEVNLCALHWFVDKIILERYLKEFILDAAHVIAMCEKNSNHKTKYTFNKIITTNSTGILKPEGSKERLQVIDCFDIFQDHLKENN